MSQAGGSGEGPSKRLPRGRAWEGCVSEGGRREDFVGSGDHGGGKSLKVRIPWAFGVGRGRKN